MEYGEEERHEKSPSDSAVAIIKKKQTKKTK